MRKHEKIKLKRESVESEALECSNVTLYNPSKEAHEGREVHTRMKNLKISKGKN